MDVLLVREAFAYNAETGELLHRKGRRAGLRTGSKHWTGYVVVRHGGKTYLAHRLAWLHVHGEWPAQDLDHINLDKADNRMCNLRLADDAKNQMNTAISSRNSSGKKGVCWNKQGKKWQAAIRVNGKSTHLGWFSDIEAAAAAYQQAASQYFGEFARAA